MASSASGAKPPRIRVTRDGPYLVSSDCTLTTRTPVLNDAGEPIDWSAGKDWTSPATYALCRCGHSAKKPFCDSSHISQGFDGTCTADRAPGATRRKLYPGVGFTMSDDESLCAGYAYCDRKGGVWRTVSKAADPAMRAEVLQQIVNCPSGRLQYTLDGKQEPEEPKFAPTVAAIPDGALWVLGGVAIETHDGFTYETRNRQLLCRCGQSGNKPFCDGTHRNVNFKAP
jgi:CDGSH-type Zn-finger protein